MMYALLLFWLSMLTVVWVSWCIYYPRTFHFRATPLGAVWIGKGVMLALMWPLLLVNEAVHVPTWVWSLLLGPGMAAASIAWLVVTIKVARDHPDARRNRGRTAL